MTHAEFLPDKINMVTEDGDVVVREDLTEAHEDSFTDPFEADRSPNYFVVQELIQASIDGSDKNAKPLGQLMATDLYKYGLPQEEVQDLLDRFLPQSVETEQSKKAVRRELGRRATYGTSDSRYYDVRERASGLHKELDD